MYARNLYNVVNQFTSINKKVKKKKSKRSLQLLLHSVAKYKSFLSVIKKEAPVAAFVTFIPCFWASEEKP